MHDKLTKLEYMSLHLMSAILSNPSTKLQDFDSEPHVVDTIDLVCFLAERLMEEELKV